MRYLVEKADEDRPVGRSAPIPQNHCNYSLLPFSWSHENGHEKHKDTPMNRDEITRKTSELSTPDTPAISLLKTVIRRKKKWHFSRAILPFRLAKRKSLSNAWEKSAGSPAERPLPLQRRNSIRIPKSHTTKPHKSTCTRPTTPQNAGKDVIQATESVVPPRQCNNCPLCSEGRWRHGCHPKEGV